MAVCGAGHSNSDAARFCTTCGAPLAAPPPADGWGPPASSPRPLPGWAPPPGLDVWSAPAARPAPVRPPSGPARPRRGRVLIVSGVIAAVVVALVAAALVLGGDPDERAAPVSTTLPVSDEVFRDLTVLSTGREGHGPLFLVHQGDPLGATAAFGGGEVRLIRRMPWSGPARPAGEPVRTADGLVPVPGGAIVAWASGDQVLVAEVILGRTAPRLLYTGGPDTQVGFDRVPSEYPQLYIEDGGACYGSEGGRPAELVTGGHASCRYQPSGQIITAEGDDDEARTFTLRERGGSPVVELAVTGRSARLVAGVIIVALEDDRYAIVNPRTGAVVEERDDVLLDGDGGPTHTSRLLAISSPRARSAQEAAIEEISRPRPAVPVAAGIAVMGRVGADGTVVVGEGDWDRSTVRAHGRVLASGPGLGFEVVGDTETEVLAWDRGGHVWFGPATAELPLVGSIPEGRSFSAITTISDHPGVIARLGKTVVQIDANGVTEYPGNWNRIEVLDASARGVLVVGERSSAAESEGSHRELLLLQGKAARTLDRGRVREGRLEGDEVVYQWQADGAPSSQAQIRRVATDGETEPKVIQRRASIALAPGRRTVWVAQETPTTWVHVSGCGSADAMSSGSSASTSFTQDTVICLAGTRRPGMIALTISSERGFHLVVENRTGPLALLDGPATRERLLIRTDGSPTMLRFTSPTGPGDRLDVMSDFDAGP